MSVANRLAKPKGRYAAQLARGSGRVGPERGAQIVEFAFVLPVLLLLVVGVWDFGSAFELQQKLTNAAREAARIVASTPENNLTSGGASCASNTPPCEFQAAADAAVSYLNNAGLSASCLTANSPSQGSSTEEWIWTCDKSGTTKLDINRGTAVSVTTSSGTLAAPAVQVFLSYPMTWKLANLLPGGIFPNVVSTKVTMQKLVP